MEKKFTYKDIDYLQSPTGWLEARLENRLCEGFEIWRDEKEVAWRGIKKLPPKTYRRDLCYVNTIIGNGKRREVVVPKWLFYLTWFAWLFKKPHFRKFKEFNVLYENYCPPNKF